MAYQSVFKRYEMKYMLQPGNYRIQAGYHSETSAPIYILQSDKVFITLAEGTANTLSNGGTFTSIDENNIDAVIFSKEDLTISGGYTTVCGPTQGDTATLDYDTSAVITGGTFIGIGASGMAQTFSDSEQGVIAVSVGDQAAGTALP